MTYTIGWDIGGAHLKVVVCNEQGQVCFVEQLETPLWKGLDVLDHAMRSVPAHLIDMASTYAMTMTGELADVFPDRCAGVNQLAQRFSAYLDPKKMRLYAGRKGWLRLDQVQGNEMSIASLNWHAAAKIISKNNKKLLLVDVGSTTTDIIPVSSGKVENLGDTDHKRLQTDELVYSGVIRTPVAAVVSKVPFAGKWQQIAAEYFATMGDIYLLTGELPENMAFATADGQGTSLQSCARRLARVLGCDNADFPVVVWQQLAAYIASQHRLIISQAIARIMSRFPGQQRALIAAGAGQFLVKKIAKEHDYPYYCFSEFVQGTESLKHAASLCAPAAACAILCRI